MLDGFIHFVAQKFFTSIRISVFLCVFFELVMLGFNHFERSSKQLLRCTKIRESSLFLVSNCL